MAKRMIKNAIKCLKCGDIIESKHQHDFKWCQCGTMFVDGGLTYRRIGGDLSMIEDMSEYIEIDEVSEYEQQI